MSGQRTVARAGDGGVRICQIKSAFERIAFAGKLNGTGVGALAGESKSAEAGAVDSGRTGCEQSVVGASGAREKSSCEREQA